MKAEIKNYLAGCLRNEDTDFEAMEWVIFGCGLRGQAALEVLRKSGMKVSFFVDNDRSKVGSTIAGLICEGREKLDQKDYCILVSPASSDELYQELKTKYKYVFPTEIIFYLKETSCYSFMDMGYSNVHNYGHYYGPYPDLNWVIEYEKNKENIRPIKDVDFNMEGQKENLDKMFALFDSLPRWNHINEKSEFRYQYGNDFYDIVDAVVLHCMLRMIKPGRLIEVGSGYSSAVTLDTNEYYFDGNMQLTFIEPYPDRLKGLLKESDRIELHEQKLQDVDLALFESLEEGDILFIDSSHMSKRDSDVNKIFFEIFPCLKPGVYIHIHDIMPGFEYPIEWLQRGNVWNEMYILRAFLQNNQSYQIQFFLGMAEEAFGAEMRAKWPFDYYRSGSDFWMKKL